MAQNAILEILPKKLFPVIFDHDGTGLVALFTLKSLPLAVPTYNIVELYGDTLKAVGEESNRLLVNESAMADEGSNFYRFI